MENFAIQDDEESLEWPTVLRGRVSGRNKAS
jgi:hypothetical protein